jgi:putative transposase
VKYVCIKEHTDEFPIRMMCRLLGVSRSGFYAWRQRPLSDKAKRSRRLLVKIKAIFKRRRRSYGSPRIWRDLVDDGERVGRGQVARLMGENGIRAKQSRRFKITTNSKHNLPVAPNILGDMEPVMVENEVWVSDITYQWTREGWLYVAAIMDLLSRRIIGWAASSRMKNDLVIQAFKRALALRGPVAGLILHSDRGSQYASHAYQALLKQYGIICSMSRKGNCWDNAPVERFFSSLKREWTGDILYRTRQAAIADVREYVAVYYNAQRLHSTLGYKTPVDFEHGFNKVSEIG